MANDLIQVFAGELAERGVFTPLPSHINPEKFKAVIITGVSRNPSLLTADRESLILACRQAAQHGLLPDGNEGILTPFRDYKTKKLMVQWTPMVKGLIKVCREQGDLTSISAYVVYEHDIFEVHLGDDAKIIHRPAMTGERGEIIAAYAIFKKGDEVIHREVMTRDEIEQTRNVSRARDGGAWSDWFGEMARKTVIRRGSKSIPLSEKATAVIQHEDQYVDFSMRSDPQPKANPLEDKFSKEVIEDAVVETFTASITEAVETMLTGSGYDKSVKSTIDGLKEDLGRADSKKSVIDTLNKWKPKVDTLGEEDREQCRKLAEQHLRKFVKKAA